MSRLISILGATEPMFTIAVQQLEQASGKLGVDVRLTEIIGQIHQKTADLRLTSKTQRARSSTPHYCIGLSETMNI
ncbi:MAG: hypothetical protein R3B12_03570 [Candidatus Saccharimonadales bacterium]